MSYRKILLLAIATFAGLPAPIFGASANPKPLAITWQPVRLVPGSPILFQIPASRPVTSVTGQWMGHDVMFFRPDATSGWYGIAAVPLATPAGSYELSLRETLAGGKSIEIAKRIKIAPATYPRIPAKVAKQFTEPNPEQLKEIGADKEVKQRAFAEVNAERLWDGTFSPPVLASISDVFGTERVFNKEVLSRHQGLDYGVPAGTPVAAINRGTVLLARPLYFEGNCVAIDHGQGLLSLYLHLSELRVKEGDAVQAHQIIGLSGNSGRATGPHLHLAVRWQGIYLDPAALLKLKIP
jgi:hypothetical protein